MFPFKKLNKYFIYTFIFSIFTSYSHAQTNSWIDDKKINQPENKVFSSKQELVAFLQNEKGGFSFKSYNDYNSEDIPYFITSKYIFKKVQSKNSSTVKTLYQYNCNQSLINLDEKYNFKNFSCLDSDKEEENNWIETNIDWYDVNAIYRDYLQKYPTIRIGQFIEDYYHKENFKTLYPNISVSQLILNKDQFENDVVKYIKNYIEKGKKIDIYYREDGSYDFSYLLVDDNIKIFKRNSIWFFDGISEFSRRELKPTYKNPPVIPIHFNNHKFDEFYLSEILDKQQTLKFNQLSKSLNLEEKTQSSKW